MACLLAMLAACETVVGERKPEPPPELAVRYICHDNTRFMARFIFAAPQRVRIERPHAPVLELAQQPAATGFAYSDGDNAFAGVGDKAEWRAAGAAPTPCVTKGPPPPYFPGAAISRPRS